MSAEELQYVLALQHIRNLGDTLTKKLIRHFGSAKSKRSKLYLKFIEKNNIQTLYFKDENYSSKN